MKHFKYFLVLMVIFSVTFFNPRPAQAVSLGPFSVTIEFCQNVSQLASIVNSFTIVQWPVGGFPGVTIGMLQNTSVVMEFCDYLTQLEQMNTTEAIFFSGNYLNQMTELKWDAHLKQADRTWNIANSVYDFESGKGRKGSYRSASDYGAMNDFIRDSYKWSNKTFNGRDAELKTRGEREADMQQFAAISYQKNIIKEMLTCPEPASGTDYGKLYQDKIVPEIANRNNAQEDYLFFKDKLFSMGPAFLDNQNDLAAYIQKIENLEAFGWVYQEAPATVNFTTMVPDGDKLDSEGRPSLKKKQITHKGQQFSVRENSNLTTPFITQYSPQWKSFVVARVIQEGSRGLLANPMARVQSQFRDFDFECRDRLLMQGYSTTAADYDITLQKRRDECSKRKFDQKKTENLINFYITEMHSALYRMKAANAKMWTIESKEMGRNRSVTTAATTEGFQQEEVKCSEKLTPAEMDQLALKQQAVNNELNTIISKELTKQTMMQEQELKNQAAVRAEGANKAKLLEQKRRERERNADQVTPALSPIRAGNSTKGRR